MRPYDLHFFPHPPLYLLAFFLLLGLAFVLLRYVLIGYVFERLGLSRRAAFAILLTWEISRPWALPWPPSGGRGPSMGSSLPASSPSSSRERQHAATRRARTAAANQGRAHESRLSGGRASCLT
jgi:hypothetical protein